MSVQVRRRREAASFLSTYVGAQGELLVDTTDNRVQVHDGATPGGWPAAGIRDVPGDNLGINTSGAVNQRGVAGTVTLSAGQYGHDRMRAGANGCTYTFTAAANGDTTFNITAGSLLQAIDVGNVFSTAMWATWTGTVGARVYQGASAPAFGAGAAVAIDATTVNALLVSGLALGTITYVEFSTGTLNTTRPWQLEAALPNAGPTRLGRRHGEMALCQRYYETLGAGFSVLACSSSAIAFGFRYAVPKRALPILIGTNSLLTLVAPGVGFYSPASGTSNTYDFTQTAPDTTGAAVRILGFNNNLPAGVPLLIVNAGYISANAEL